jgi:glucokinase
MPAVLALDLGGTVLKAGVVDEHGTTLIHRSAPAGEAKGVAGWLAAVHEIAAGVLADSAVQPVATGVSVPGAVDASSGRLLDLVARLDVGEDGVDLGAALVELGLPVFADNDARAALAAERRWGVARGSDHVAMLTLGTGVGGAVVIDGAPPGTDVLAGNQIGHFTIDLHGEPCVCGNRGCADTLASATGLLRLAAQRGRSYSDGAAVFAAAARGDDTARGAVEQFTAALTALVVTVIHAYQSEIVVIGGGLSGAAELFLPVVQEQVAARAWTLPRGRARVAPTALPQLGVAGAAAVAFAAMPTNSSHHETTSRRAS